MFKTTREEAFAIIKALCGGRSPSHGDTIQFMAGGEGRDLGFIFGPVSSVDTEDPDEDDDDGSSPGTGGGGLPGAVNIYNRVVANFHDDDPDADRIDALCNLWLGAAQPNNHQTPDVWIKFAS